MWAYPACTPTRQVIKETNTAITPVHTTDGLKIECRMS